MICYAITTSDNPFNPLEQFESWKEFDDLKRYGTCEYLDRVTFTSDSMSEQEYEDEIERGIDEIIRFNPIVSVDPPVCYVKVSKEINN